MSTASTSTLSSVLSALGGSTGIDVTSAVDSILYADRAPERTWQAQQTALASQTTAIHQLNSDSSTLSDQLSLLQGIGSVLNSVSVASSDSSVVSATAADGTTIGNHTVVVTSLATTASWYSAEESSGSATLAAGSFQITSGGTTTTIQVGNGNNTLDQLATAINSQSLGVTASVVTDSNGARLSLVANSSGTAANFTISQASGLTFTQAQTGANAALTVDGVPISSASNTVVGALNGVTLNLASASPNETVNLTLSPDITDITSAVTNFVSAYNSVINDVSTDIAYNATTSTAGPLQADSAAQSFYSDLLAATNYNSGSGTLNTLTSLGINTNSDGTLSLDTSTLASALQSNPSGVAAFFQGTSDSGFAASLTNTLNTYTDPSDGAFTIDLQSISAENQDLNDQINTLETYLSSQQTLLTTQYNNADIAIQQLPQQIKNTDALLGLNQNSNNN
jgi:flagellar hook-associated protein 2